MRIIAVATAALVALGLACIVTGTVPSAQAQVQHVSSAHCWDIYGCPRQRSRRRVVRKARPAPEPRYYAAPRWRDGEPTDGNPRPLCVRDDVEVVSTEHTTKDNAMDAARKMWAFTTQWRWGSQYMDLELADDFRMNCGPSNAMDTATGKINEAVSSIVGKEGVNQRCVIRARPCRAQLEPDEGGR